MQLCRFYTCHTSDTHQRRRSGRQHQFAGDQRTVRKRIHFDGQRRGGEESATSHSKSVPGSKQAWIWDSASNASTCSRSLVAALTAAGRGSAASKSPVLRRSASRRMAEAVAWIWRHSCPHVARQAILPWFASGRSPVAEPAQQCAPADDPGWHSPVDDDHSSQGHSAQELPDHRQRRGLLIRDHIDLHHLGHRPLPIAFGICLVQDVLFRDDACQTTLGVDDRQDMDGQSREQLRRLQQRLVTRTESPWA